MYHKISKGTTRRTEVEGINLKSVEAENQISTRISTSQPIKKKKNLLNQSIFKKQQRKRKERSLQNLKVKKNNENKFKHINVVIKWNGLIS